MKILHVFPADAKFFNVVKTSLSQDERISNEYLMVGDPRTFAVKDPAILDVLGHDEIRAKFRSLVDGYDGVSFHFMDRHKMGLLEATPLGKVVTWHSWGMDAVDAIYRSPSLAQFKPDTFRSHCRSIATPPVLEVGKAFVRGLLHWKNDYVRELTRLLPRIDFMTTVTREEYRAFSRRFGRATPPRLDFGYDWVESSEDQPVSGRNILLGNSSFRYNNHMEALQQLARMDLSDRKVIVPLSYGEEAYKDELIGYGRSLLGDRIDFLVSFLPKDEYFQVMNSCGFFVSNSKVQMAAGNVIHAISRGLKVVLDPENPLYSDLTNDGYVIASVKALGDHAEGLMPLSDSDIETNRRLILRDWGKNAILHKNDLLVKAQYSLFCERTMR